MHIMVDISQKKKTINPDTQLVNNLDHGIQYLIGVTSTLQCQLSTLVSVTIWQFLQLYLRWKVLNPRCVPHNAFSLILVLLLKFPTFIAAFVFPMMQQRLTDNHWRASSNKKGDYNYAALVS